MFCRYCGNEMQPGAVICTKCGVAAGSGNSFCPNCGVQVNEMAAYCVKCGASLSQTPQQAPANAKSKMVAGLLGIFLGNFGVHNFYLGYISKAVIQLVTSIVGLASYIAFIVIAVATTFQMQTNELPELFDDYSYSYQYTASGPSPVVFIFLVLFFITVIGIRIWTIVESVFIFMGKTNDAKGNPLKN